MAQRPPDISAQQAKINRLLRQRDFNKFSGNLAKILAETWVAAGKVGLRALNDYLKGTAAFKVGEIDDVIEILKGALSTDFTANIQPVVNGSVKHVYGLGMNEVKVGLAKSFEVIDHRAVRWLHEHHMYWAGNRYDSHFAKRVKDLGDFAIKNGWSRERTGKLFANVLPSKDWQNESYWEMTADAITTRSRSFGSIEGLVKAGAKKYEWDSVIDHRTSDICRYLDGKVFEVAAAVDVRDRMIAAETPEEAKEIMPWAKPDDVVDRSTRELQELGVVLPPAHGRCRARIVIH